MPFLNKEVIQYFLDLAETAEIVVHRLNDYWEPLHAVYSRSFMKSIERLIELGERKIIKGYKWTKVHEVTREELTLLDPDLRSLLNFNTPEELKKLLDIYTPYG
jgi:molybdopterin-guanine dinucleotide biosynthesis protein A